MIAMNDIEGLFHDINSITYWALYTGDFGVSFWDWRRSRISSKKRTIGQYYSAIDCSISW